MMSETRLTPDAGAYLRSHAWMAAFAMAAAMGALWATGSPHIWTGAVGGLAAITFRALYARKEELAATWVLGADALTGPTGHRIATTNIASVKALGSYVQVITKDGHKHLIKYQADPAATIAAIERACL